MRNTKSVLYFTHGRGHYHAAWDISTIDEIRAQCPDLEVLFVSNSVGAETFSLLGRNVINSMTSESANSTASLIAAYNVLKKVNPSLVVAHEEYSAVAAAGLLGIPSVYITSWLPLTGSVGATSIKDAAAVIVLEEPGSFQIPIPLKSKPLFVGRQSRAVKFRRCDRARLREKHGIKDSEYVVTVVPGGALGEEKAPILDVVLEAFSTFKCSDKRMFWITARDIGFARERMRDFSNISIIEFTPNYDEYIAMSDVVIAKGRGAVLDAAGAGVSSISLSPQVNPIDDIILSRISSNTPLGLRACDGPSLHYYLERKGRRTAADPVVVDEAIVANPEVPVLHSILMDKMEGIFERIKTAVA
jgi:hypothetical protein